MPCKYAKRSVMQRSDGLHEPSSDVGLSLTKSAVATHGRYCLTHIWVSFPHSSLFPKIGIRTQMTSRYRLILERLQALCQWMTQMNLRFSVSIELPRDHDFVKSPFFLQTCNALGMAKVSIDGYQVSLVTSKCLTNAKYVNYGWNIFTSDSIILRDLQKISQKKGRFWPALFCTVQLRGVYI